MWVAIIFCAAILIAPLALDIYVHGRDNTLRNTWCDFIDVLERWASNHKQRSRLEDAINALSARTGWRMFVKGGAMATVVVGGTLFFWEAVYLLVRVAAIVVKVLH